MNAIRLETELHNALDRAEEFVIGLLPKPLQERAIYGWLERGFQRGKRRTARCTHPRTTQVDHGDGMGLVVLYDKCLDCWAIRSKDDPERGWSMNAARPPKGAS